MALNGSAPVDPNTPAGHLKVVETILPRATAVRPAGISDDQNTDIFKMAVAFATGDEATETASDGTITLAGYAKITGWPKQEALLVVHEQGLERGKHYSAPGPIKLIKRTNQPNPKSKANYKILLTPIGKHALAPHIPGGLGLQYSDYVFQVVALARQAINELRADLLKYHTALAHLTQQRSDKYSSRSKTFKRLVGCSAAEATSLCLLSDKSAYRKCFLPDFQSASQAVRIVQGHQPKQKIRNAVSSHFTPHGMLVDAFTKSHEEQVCIQREAEVITLPTETARKRKIEQIRNEVHQKFADNRTFVVSGDKLQQAQAFIRTDPIKRTRRALH